MALSREKKIERARELRAANQTLPEIARQLGETVNTVAYWAKGVRIEKACPGCGKDLTGSHGRTKWCSDRCRKETLYFGTCVECGGRTTGRANGNDRVPQRCGDCAMRAQRKDERNALLREMWEADEPTWYIAQKLGMTETAVLAWVDSERRIRGDQTLPKRRLGGGAAERRKRHRRMIKLRRQGLSNAEIAVVVGMASRGAVAVSFRHMRDKGWDVPPAPSGRKAAA